MPVTPVAMASTLARTSGRRRAVRRDDADAQPRDLPGGAQFAQGVEGVHISEVVAEHHDAVERVRRRRGGERVPLVDRHRRANLDQRAPLGELQPLARRRAVRAGRRARHGPRDDSARGGNGRSRSAPCPPGSCRAAAARSRKRSITRWTLAAHRERHRASAVSVPPDERLHAVIADDGQTPGSPRCSRHPRRGARQRGDERQARHAARMSARRASSSTRAAPGVAAMGAIVPSMSVTTPARGKRSRRSSSFGSAGGGMTSGARRISRRHGSISGTGLRSRSRAAAAFGAGALAARLPRDEGEEEPRRR